MRATQTPPDAAPLPQPASGGARHLTVGCAAFASGLSVSGVRRIQAEIPSLAGEHRPGTWRRSGVREVERLALVAQCLRLGISVPEAAALLDAIGDMRGCVTLTRTDDGCLGIVTGGDLPPVAIHLDLSALAAKARRRLRSFRSNMPPVAAKESAE